MAGEPCRDDFTRAWNCADRRLLLDVRPLGAQIARRRAGSSVLCARLEHYDASPPTESVLEERFLELCRVFSIPSPVCQWPLGSGDRLGRVDFVWPGKRVAAEVDGRRWHAIQAAFERDREKDLQLREAGFDPHRYTYRQVTDQAARVASGVLRALG